MAETTSMDGLSGTGVVAESLWFTDEPIRPAMLALPPAPTCVPSETEESVSCGINPASSDEIAFVPVLPRAHLQINLSHTAEDIDTNICTEPRHEVAEAEESRPAVASDQGEEGTIEFPALLDSEIVEFTQPPLPLAGCEISAIFHAQPETDSAEWNLLPKCENEISSATAPQMEDLGESDPSGSLQIAPAEKESSVPDLLSFFGLNQQPFDVTPDPAYLYPSRMHQEALTALSQGVEHLRGFMALVAEPGMGKTTLLNKLMEELSESARVVFLFQTQCSSSELLRYLLTELGVDHDGMDVVAMHRKLSQVLFEEMLLGRRFVLIVDEAQNLQDSVLETIRLLSDYETTHSKLIQIVLAGQPQLVETLMRLNLSQLRQRIAVLANLQPLSVAETAEYIQHRLRASGSSGGSIFTSEAMTQIAEQSKGTPRSINNLCFNAMLAGYLQKQEILDCEIVSKVASKLDLEMLVRPSQQEPANNPPAAPSGAESLAQLAGVLLNALTRERKPELGPVEQVKIQPGLSLKGKLMEKLPSNSWSGENECKIEVSLEREHKPGVPIAEHYYCRGFYVNEQQAASLQTGKPIRIRFEQD